MVQKKNRTAAIGPQQNPENSITQPALLGVKPNTLTRSLTLTHALIVDTVDRAAGCQTDRWCADNAVSLEQCTKALRAGQEIHLAERWERDGGEDQNGNCGRKRVAVAAVRGLVLEPAWIFLQVT